MLTITIIGTTPPCAKCRRAEREALEAARAFAGRVEVAKLDALDPATEAYGLVVTPAVVVGDELVGSGRIVPAAELGEHIRRHLEV